MWTANDLNKNIDIVDKDERWYENVLPTENIVTNESRHYHRRDEWLKLTWGRLKLLLLLK